MVLIIACLLCRDAVASERRWFVPDYTKIQFAGNTGFLSVGVGYLCFGEKLQLDVSYGYVPAFIGGVNIHTISQKSSIALKTFKLSENVTLSPTAAVGVNIVLGEKYLVLLSDKYPDGYYWPVALHFAPCIGARVHKQLHGLSKIKGLDIYFELGTIDYYIRDFVKSDYVGLTDILNVSIGVVVFF